MLIKESVQDYMLEYRDDLTVSDITSDSLEVIEIRIELEEFYGIEITDEEFFKLEKIKDVMQLVGDKYHAKTV